MAQERSRKKQVSIAFRPAQLANLRQIAQSKEVSLGHLIRREADRLIKRETKGA